VQERPQARTEGLVSEWAEEDLLIYDRTTNVAHSLSGAASRVWGLCDGELTVDEIAERTGIHAELVLHALDEIDGCGLLDHGPVLGDRISRRQMTKRIVGVGGAAFLAPMVFSVGVAAAQSGASCPATLTCGSSTGQCDASGDAGFGSVVGQTSCICYQNAVGDCNPVVSATSCAVYEGKCKGNNSLLCCDPSATCASGKGGIGKGCSS
jgi:hypothetical protein